MIAGAIVLIYCIILPYFYLSGNTTTEISEGISNYSNTPLYYNYTQIKNSSAIATYETLSYQNEEYGISINYPKGWEKRIKDDYNTEFSKILVFFMSQLESKLDFQENINLGITEFYSQGTNENEIPEITQKDVDELKEIMIEGLKEEALNPQIIEIRDIKFDEYIGFQMIYTADGFKSAPKDMDSPKMKLAYTAIFTKLRVYDIVYTATIEGYSKYGNVLEQMINSLEINT